MSSSVTYRWVIVELDPKLDERSINHAKAGIGYYIISPPANRNDVFIAAYKHFGGSIGRGVLASDEQAKKLEEADNNRYHWEAVSDNRRNIREMKNNRAEALEQQALQQ